MSALPPPAAPIGRAAQALKDAILTSLLTLVLAGPMLGLQTVTGEKYGLDINPQWAKVGVVLAVAFLGRFALSMLVGGRVGKAQRPAGDPADSIMAHVERVALPAVLGVAFLIPILAILFPDMIGRATLDIGILILTYVMLAWGLQIVVGFAGLLDLGFVAFYAVGAYSYAMLAQGLGWSFWACLPIAGMLAAMFGVLLGIPVLRLRGDYFAIVTLGFGEIIRIVLLNWSPVTGGPNGINNIPRPTFFGLPFQRNDPPGGQAFHTYFGLEFSQVHRIIFFYFVILALAIVTAVVARRLRRLPVGRAWEALREDDVACQALGIDRTKTKLAAFAVGALFAGLGGCFFATRQGFISPESFNFLESAMILAIVVLGGMGSQLGAVIAATLLVGAPEALRELQDYRMIVFGALMVLIMIWRPRGLIEFREPTVRLNARP